MLRFEGDRESNFSAKTSQTLGQNPQKVHDEQLAEASLAARGERGVAL
jgi:hypothetical protein